MADRAADVDVGILTADAPAFGLQVRAALDEILILRDGEHAGETPEEIDGFAAFAEAELRDVGFGAGVAEEGLVAADEDLAVPEPRLTDGSVLHEEPFALADIRRGSAAGPITELDME